MTTIYHYRLKCTTDNKNEFVWSDTVPTTCPINTSHTIDTSSIVVVGKKNDNELSIKEETTPTGGHFSTHTVHIDAAQNTTTPYVIKFPFPISALMVSFVSEETHRADSISLIVGKNAIIGAITTNITAKNAWISQNYVVNDEVRYDDGNGYKNYICILNTVSNEVPTNTIYWSVSTLSIDVSLTVIQNTALGYYVNINDGINEDNVGRVTKVDTINNKIEVEFSTINNYLYIMPTYILNSVYMFKDYEIGPPWEHTIGESKIGGSSVPTNMPITIEYTNISPSTNKVLIGRVEYLY